MIGSQSCYSAAPLPRFHSTDPDSPEPHKNERLTPSPHHVEFMDSVLIEGEISPRKQCAPACYSRAVFLELEAKASEL